MDRNLTPSIPVSARSRVDRLCSLAGIVGSHDHVIVTSPEDIRWLSGFTGSFGWLVVGSDEVLLATDGRYLDQARLESERIGLDLRVVEVASGDSLGAITSRVLSARGGSESARALFQPDFLTVQQFRSLEAAVDGVLEPVAPDVRHLRRHKDAGELAAIARAAALADMALQETIPLLTTRPSERDVRDELEYRMRRLGADGPSYDTIVASGPVNAAKPHHRPDSTVIEEGHSVVIDVGALVDGYHSDMTRTFLVGDVSPELRHFFDVVHEVQERAVAAVAPGVTCSEIDRLCRDAFREHGVEECFIHGTGHGVGLAIHEEPFIGRSGPGIFEVGDVVTIEPGLYRMGLGGVRIEDLLVVTEEAHLCLTSLPKDLPCPPSQPTT